jgi:putative flippase GtrA
MKIVRYFFIGGIAAAVDIGVFAVFAKLLGFNYLAVAAVGFVLATLVNYFLSVRHVFESGVRFGRRQEIAIVYLVSTVGLAINQTVLYVGIDLLGWEMIVTKLVATGVVFFWNYGARAHFVFRPADQVRTS